MFHTTRGARRHPGSGSTLREPHDTGKHWRDQEELEGVYGRLVYYAVTIHVTQRFGRLC
jgi:hypothetical protein